MFFCVIDENVGFLGELLDGGQTEEGLLYDVLHKMVVCEKLDNFPLESADILLGLLDEIHEPQVSLLTCVIIGQMCNLTSVARIHLAQRGALSSLEHNLDCKTSALYVYGSADTAETNVQLESFIAG